MRLAWVAAGVLILDQATKVIVRLRMVQGESIPLIGDWLKFTFTENPGMAFGINFGPAGLITGFSIVATALIVVYLFSVRNGYIWYCVSLASVLGGALGNIVDRLFYGQIYDYGSFFKGRVVDFLHVDLWTGFLPDLIPVMGGSYVSVFPIFNVADIGIVCGVVGIMMFQKQFHQSMASEVEEAAEQEEIAEVQPEAPEHSHLEPEIERLTGLSDQG